MSADPDRRVVGATLLAGAAVAVASNAMHPIFPPDVTTEAVLRGAASSGGWLVIHLALATAVVISTVGLRMLAQLLSPTRGRTFAAMTSGLATIGGAIFVVQLAGIDGMVLPTLAEQLDDARTDGIITIATAWISFDFALLSLSVALFLGATNVALGMATLRAGVFSPWLRWTALVVGVTGTANGLLMFLGIGDAVTLYAFRLLGLAGTIVGAALGFELLRPANPLRPHSRHGTTSQAG